MQEQQTKEFYDFGEFRLDLKNRLLWRAGEPVALNLKEFEVLLFLVENAGRVVEKDALLDAVWKDTFISEGALTQNISRLRKKLEAAAGNSEKIIETLPKRGYRFLPPVKTIEAPPALIVKEQTVQRIRVEETISLPEPPALERRANLALQNPKSEIRNPKLLWIAVVLGFTLASAIGFAVYQNNFRKPETKSVLIARVVPFSGLTGREDMPAFSPDGKQMAFSWNGGDSEKDLDVYVKIIGAGEPVRLTSGANDEIYPTFSPDNRQIAFVRSFPSRSEVFLVPALGGAERKICELNSEWSSISFSPDGQTLAVVDSISAGKQSGIFLVNLQTGERRQLTAPPESIRDTTPRFSPDGASLAFLRNFGESIREVYIVQTAASERNVN
ncbi:MAG TPA: winged helix-turn-helix domain-containing protein [Pyrinomonadaceae bacterium]